MATNNNIKNYSAADIERYHKGLLSSQERHAMEKAALDDPFLADALEGYAVAGTNTAADLEELRERLAQRTGGAKLIPLQTERKERKAIPWLRIAIMLVILVGAGLLANQFLFRNNKQGEIAQLKEPDKDDIKIPDSIVNPGDKEVSAVTNADTKKTVAPVASGNAQPTTNSGSTKDSLSPITPETSTSDLAVSTTQPRNSAPAKAVEVKDENTQRKFQNDKLKDNVAKEGGKQRNTTPEKREVDKEVVVTSTEKAENYYKRSNEDTRGIVNNRRADNNQYRANTFHGYVTDNNNRGVPFANVTNVRDNVGTYTDATGRFTLTSPDTVLDVQVRSVGLENNVVQLRNSVPLNQVVLQDDRSDVVINNLNAKKPNAERRRQDANLKLEEPEPADGWENYDVYLVNNLNVPTEFKSRQDGKQEVEVSFEVDKNGKPTNIRVEKSLCKTCDEEAKRLVKEGPRWKRKAKKGRTTVTITF